jgi:Holliday junction resolvase RusA-like endonuclease
MRVVPHEQGAEERGDLIARLWIPGQPIPAPRVKVGRWGAYYTPAYSEWLEAAKQKVDSDYPQEPLTGFVRIELKCVIARAKSHYGTGKNADKLKPSMAEKHPIPRGDVDNLAKGPLDALTGRVYPDDLQVTQLLVKKRWAGPHELPGVEIKIFEL